MNNRKYNQDIKQLNKAIFKASQKVDISGNNDEYFAFINGEAKKEFMRIYNANDTFEGLNKISILIMMRLNIRHRFVPFHLFGININLALL
jgi:hypothetical protein